MRPLNRRGSQKPPSQPSGSVRNPWPAPRMTSASGTASHQRSVSVWMRSRRITAAPVRLHAARYAIVSSRFAPESQNRHR